MTDDEFESLLSNIAASPDLADEADTFRRLCNVLWDVMTPTQKVVASKTLDFEEIVETATEWAGGCDKDG